MGSLSAILLVALHYYLALQSTLEWFILLYSHTHFSMTCQQQGRPGQQVVWSLFDLVHCDFEFGIIISCFFSNRL